jgi:ABC-type Fe3+ transport system permease subunit
MLREMWRASDPTVPVGSDDWKQRPVAPIVVVWWVLYGLVPLGLAVVQGVQAVQTGFAGDARDLAEALDDQFTITLVAGVVSLVGAVSWALVVRGLTDRHRQLTGEAVAVA